MGREDDESANANANASLKPLKSLKASSFRNSSSISSTNSTRNSNGNGNGKLERNNHTFTASTSSAASSSRPTPLKQRTSSVDTSRDFSYFTTWWSLCTLLKPREFFIAVNNYPIWRRHVAWAMESGSDLRTYMTQRFASSMIFLSLMLSAELSVLFNSAQITSAIRLALKQEQFFSIQFWVGVTILMSIILTLLSLITTFTAWGMVSAISDENAHCILRSSIGIYAGELPQRFVVASIYSFLIWILLMFFILMPVGFGSILMVTVVLGLFFHVVTVFSALGRLILHTTAMSPTPIFDPAYERALTPRPLQHQLHMKAMAELSNSTSITRQYRRKVKPLNRPYQDVEELAAHLKSQRQQHQLQQQQQQQQDQRQQHKSGPTISTTVDSRRRADSAVRFADDLFSTPVLTRDEKNESHPLSLMDQRPTILSTTMENSSSRASSRNSSRASSPAMEPPGVDMKSPLSTTRKEHASRPSNVASSPAPPRSSSGGLSTTSLDSWLSGTRNDIPNMMTPPKPPPKRLPPREIVALSRQPARAISSVGTYDSDDERSMTPLPRPLLGTPDLFPSQSLLSDDNEQTPPDLLGYDDPSFNDDEKFKHNLMAGDESGSIVSRPLTEDEKFDRDYGDDLPRSMNGIPSMMDDDNDRDGDDDHDNDDGAFVEAYCNRDDELRQPDDDDRQSLTNALTTTLAGSETQPLLEYSRSSNHNYDSTSLDDVI